MSKLLTLTARLKQLSEQLVSAKTEDERDEIQDEIDEIEDQLDMLESAHGVHENDWK